MQRRKEKQKKSLHMYICLVVKYRTTNWTNFKAAVVVVTRLALAWIPSYVPYIPYHPSMPFSEKLDIYHLPSHTSTRSNNQPLSSPSQPTIVPTRPCSRKHPQHVPALGRTTAHHRPNQSKQTAVPTRPCPTQNPAINAITSMRPNQQWTNASVSTPKKNVTNST